MNNNQNASQFKIKSIFLQLRRLTYWTRNHPKPRVSLTTVSQNKKKLREEKYGKKDDSKKDNENSAGCLSRCIKEEDTETDIRVNVQGYSIKVNHMKRIPFH